MNFANKANIWKILSAYAVVPVCRLVPLGCYNLAELTAKRKLSALTLVASPVHMQEGKK